MLLIAMSDISIIIVKNILKQEKRTIKTIDKIIGLSMHWFHTLMDWLWEFDTLFKKQV